MMSLLKLWIVCHGRADSQASLLHTFAEEVFDGVVVTVVGGRWANERLLFNVLGPISICAPVLVDV